MTKKRLLQELRIQLNEYPMIKQRTYARWGAVGVASLVLLVSGTASVYAYESPVVVDGHPFYPLKQTLETAEHQFAQWRGKPGEFHAKMMERRLNEFDIHQGKPEQQQVLLTAAAEELGMTVEELRQGLHDPQKRSALIEKLTVSADASNGLIQRFVSHISEQDPVNGPRLKRLDKLGLGEELKTLREEVQAMDIPFEQKREQMIQKAEVLFEQQKAKIDARRSELQSQGLSEESIRTTLEEEFGFPPRGGMGKGFPMQRPLDNK